MSSGSLSSSRLLRMHDALAAYVERGEVPGIVTLVSRREEVHVDCIGYPRDTIFRMASMTKPVTAAAVMIIVEDGVIDLDDPVGDLLPELAEPRVLRSIDAALDDTVPARRAVTVRDLLTFTLGTGVVVAPPGNVRHSACSRGGRLWRQPRPEAGSDRIPSPSGDVPSGPSARRGLDVQHRLRRPRHPRRARHRTQLR